MNIDLNLFGIIFLSLLMGVLLGIGMCKVYVDRLKRQIEHSAQTGDPIAIGLAVLHVVTSSTHYRYKVAEKFMHDSLKRRAERHEFLERFNSN